MATIITSPYLFFILFIVLLLLVLVLRAVGLHLPLLGDVVLNIPKPETKYNAEELILFNRFTLEYYFYKSFQDILI